MATATLGSKSVNSVVKIKVSGKARNFVIKNKESTQVALIVEDIYTTDTWSNANNSQCTTFYNAIDEEIRSQIIGSKCFLPSYDQANGGWSGFNSNANRVAKYNGSASAWWLSSTYTIVNYYYVRSSGGFGNSNFDLTYGVRPALYLSPDLLVSDDGMVSTNTPPAITSTSGTDLGEKNEPFAVHYSVADADGDSLTVTEKIDGVTMKTRTGVASGSEFDTEAASDAAAWQKILNGSHSLKIEVSDGKESTSWDGSFEKAVHKATITLDAPLAVEGDITVARLAVTGEIPEDAMYSVKVTNNGNDAEPVWQDATSEVKSGENIVFENHENTNGAAFNFKVEVERGPSGAGGYITGVSGAFQ